MKPAWDQLGDEFAGSKTVIIADVDCTVEKDLCSKYGVRGYPTIKTFTGNPDGDAYEGGRDFDALKKFADESLGPSCSNDNIDLCDDDQKKILDKYNAGWETPDLFGNIFMQQNGIKLITELNYDFLII